MEYFWKILSQRGGKILIITGLVIGIALFYYANNERIGEMMSARGSLEEKLIQLQQTCPSSQYRTDRIQCFVRSLPPIISFAGFANTMEALTRLVNAHKIPEPGNITGCHDLFHAVGIANVTTSGDIAKTLSLCTSLCTFGCYHGAIEGYVLRGGDFENDIANLCMTTQQKNRPACFHGLGHGAAFVGNYTLSGATQLCDKLTDENARRDCASGVLMELYEPSTFDHPRLEFPDDIPSFCSTLKGVYAEVCFTTAGLHEYGRSLDAKKAFDICAFVPASFRRRCLVNIGQNFYFVFQGSAREIVDACNTSENNDNLESCLEGALMSSNISSSISNGRAICDSSPEGAKERCHQFLSSFSSSL